MFSCIHPSIPAAAAGEWGDLAGMLVAGDAPGCGDHEGQAAAGRGGPQGGDSGLAPGGHFRQTRFSCHAAGSGSLLQAADSALGEYSALIQQVVQSFLVKGTFPTASV